MNEQEDPSPAKGDGGNADDSGGSTSAENPAPTSDETRTEMGSTAQAEAPLDEEARPVSPAEDDLPEWEPLTPELVEDEAIRGDVMLRWAVILLAVLMGWSIVQETSVLTHIKSGEAIAANGFLPPRTDPLSSTAGDRKWVNLPWLWDLSLAGVHGLLGASGLTFLKTGFAALIFWLLSRISLPGVPTWWGSVCGALALLAAFPSLTPTPTIVTLLGIVLLLWLLPLGQAESGASPRPGWMIVLLLLVWNQLDDRAWIGLGALLLFAVGNWWDERTFQDETRSKGISLGMVALASTAIMLLHPFLWESLLSPIRLYQLEYPALQKYASPDLPFLYERFPMWSPRFWEVSYFNGAGVLLWGATVVTLVLNAHRLRMSHLVLFVFGSVLIVAGGKELAVASLINAALATVNAQQWYLSSFRQSYSVESTELLFSRGGRAITVIAFFALAFAMVSGHLTGADGRRVGMGIDRSLQQQIVSYKNVLEDSYDERPFNVRPDQGDILNWIGQRPFLDSRLRLFAAGAPSLVEQHLKARNSLRLSRVGLGTSSDPETGQEIFARYEITHVVPRLSGDNPDYVTFGDLNLNPDWSLTELGAATAVFYRTDLSDPQLWAYVADHTASTYVDSVLRTRNSDVVVVGQRPNWPQPPSVYDRYMYLPRSTSVNALQLGRHYLSLVNHATADVSLGEVIGMLYAAIRRTHDGLAERPSDPTAYHVLGQAYGLLWQLERDVMQRNGLVYAGSLRYLQTIAAFHHVLACAPQDAMANYQLFRIYSQQQRQDLAGKHLRRFQELTGRLSLLPESDASAAETEGQLSEALVTMMATIAETRQALQEDLDAGADRVMIVQNASQSGFPLLALEMLEDDLTVVSGNPAAAHLYGRLLLEAGRTSEAYDQLQGVKTLNDQQPHLGEWPTDVAISEVIAEDLRGALSTLKEEQQRLSTGATGMLLQSGPLRTSAALPPDGEVNPLLSASRRTQMVGIYFDQLLPRLDANSLHQALIELELGENAGAQEHLLELLTRNPVSLLRPLAEMYLNLLSGDPEIPPMPDDLGEISELEPAAEELKDDESSDPDEKASPAEKDSASDVANPKPSEPSPDAANGAEKEASPDNE